MEEKINLNKKVSVILTKEGAEAFNRHNMKLIDDFLKVFPKADMNFLKTDYIEGDVIEDSLWCIFSSLGDYFNGNTNAPFKNNEITLKD